MILSESCALEEVTLEPSKVPNSSSTTGIPKAAVVSPSNFVAQYNLILTDNVRIHNIRRLLTCPMFHAAAVPVSHTTTLKAGQIGFVMRRLDLQYPGPFDSGPFDY